MIKYISKYASEPETISGGYHHALNDAPACLKASPLKTAVRRFFTSTRMAARPPRPAPPRPPTLLLHLRRSRSRPDCVPHPPEARHLSHLASHQRHPEPAPSPTSTRGPCLNYDRTSHSAPSRNFPPLTSGRSPTSTLLPVASPTSTAHNTTWTPIPTPIWSWLFWHDGQRHRRKSPEAGRLQCQQLMSA